MHEFEPYRDLIEQLKTVVYRPDFNQALSEIAAQIPHSRRLVLKMEVKRLAQPCDKSIDLRGVIDGRCRHYDYEGITHFLDDVAIEIFERQIRTFGRYTLGVYESVLDPEHPLRLPGPSLTADQSVLQHAQWDLIPSAFGQKLQRAEERMNLSASVELFDESGNKSDATSIDISVHGLRVKLKSGGRFKAQQRILVRFTSLGGSYSFDFNEAIPYEVIAIEKRRNEHRLALKRSYLRDTPSFDYFLQRFILQNKRRLKLNLDNTEEAILTKGLEQFILPQSHTLPVFIEQTQSQLQSRFCLCNQANTETLHYLTDQQGRLHLSALLSPQRLQQWQSAKLSGTLLFCFYDSGQIKPGFYSASWHELAGDPQRANIFRAIAARYASFRVFSISLQEIDPSDCHLPNSIPPEHQLETTTPSLSLAEKIQDLSHLVQITDVTDQWAIQPYYRFKIQVSHLPVIEPFRHRDPAHNSVTLAGFRFTNAYRYERYQLRTSVTLESHHQKLTGQTETVALHQVRLQLQKPFSGAVSQDVTLHFNALRQNGEFSKIQDLHYEVRGISPDRRVLTLRLTSHLPSTEAHRLFIRLVATHRVDLQQWQDSDRANGLGEGLRNLIAPRMTGITVFLNSRQRQWSPCRVMKAPLSHSLYPLMTYGLDNGRYNMGLFFSHAQGDTFNKALNSLKTSDRPLKKELFIHLSENNKKSPEVRFIEQFKSDKARRDFIQHATNNGRFYAVSVFLARTGRPDIALLKREMRYLGLYAEHKAEALDNALWDIAATAELFDCTEEAALRYGLTLTA